MVAAVAKFSAVFGISPGPEDDWFDPDLSVDTRLFLDPFLLLAESADPWSASHDQIIEHFTQCYTLLAKGGGKGTLSEQTARALLQFPEPAELCLGYTASGTAGSGGGGQQANAIVSSIVVAIAAGLTEPEHIEEIGILNEGIGADRISDAVCNILKPTLIEYTKEVAARHGVPTSPVIVRHAACDRESGRWLDEEHELPINPFTGGPILLVPARFLSDLPALNADDWWHSSLNAAVRRQLNLRVGQRVPKKEIVKAARKNPLAIREWASALSESGAVRGYDFEADPLGVVGWQTAGATFAAAHPIQLDESIETQADLEQFVSEVVRLFRLFVEQQGGWKLLWNDDGSEKPEEAAQLLFLGIARPYCRLHGIELDREVNFGRGPVDFKLNAGGRCRLLIEAKKLHSGTFWNGLEKQLTSYMESDETTAGWLLAIQYREGGISKERRTELPGRVRELNAALGTRIQFRTVDATPKLSASKLT